MQELAAGVVLITVVGQSFCLRFICLNSPKDSDSFWLTLQQRLENLIDPDGDKVRRNGRMRCSRRIQAVVFELS